MSQLRELNPGGRTGVADFEPAMITHLKQLYDSHSNQNDNSWHEAEISNFFEHVQRESASQSAPDLTNKNILDFDDFLKYMASESANALAPFMEQDLSWPLSAYFINSSHNTYLDGNQLYGEVTTEAYKEVLLRGCRCIEIDCWDGAEPESESDNSTVSGAGRPEKPSRMVQAIKKRLPASLLNLMDETSIGTKTNEDVEKKPDTDLSGNATSTAEQPAHDQASSITIAPVEPRVLHGHTLTNEISFRDACEVIREYAFAATDLPLIVSLEVHCSASQQEMMVDIMRETWKDYLVDSPMENSHTLPSPGSLMKKILIKVKYNPPGPVSLDHRLATMMGPAEEFEETMTGKDAKKKQPIKIIQALSDLGIYTRGVSFKNLSQPEATMPSHIFSLSEKKVLEVYKHSPSQLCEHNKRYLMRVYPSGLRWLSGNLEPCGYWRKGIQVVALNWQSLDDTMMINNAMFAGSKGYLLKPEGYRPSDANEVGSPSEAEDMETTNQRNLDLTIQFIAAQSIPVYKNCKGKAAGFRPYVKVELDVGKLGELVGKSKEEVYKAKTKTYNGDSPDFNGEEVRLEGISGAVPMLSFVWFTIQHQVDFGRDVLSARACVRLDRLSEGYRFVHLFDELGFKSDGVLLVKVSKKMA